MFLATIAAGVLGSVPASSMTAGTHAAEFNCTGCGGQCQVGASVSFPSPRCSAPQPPGPRFLALIVLPSGVPSSGL